MKYPWVYKGNKVICIDDNWGSNIDNSTYYVEFPKYKKIYTIREIARYTNKIGLMFIEIRNPKYMNLIDENGNLILGEISFDATQFKPLEYKSFEDDISMFNEIINKDLIKVN